MKNSIVTIFVATALLLATSTGCRKRTNSEEEAPPDTSTYHPEATPATQFERDNDSRSFVRNEPSLTVGLLTQHARVSAPVFQIAPDLPSPHVPCALQRVKRCDRLWRESGQSQ